MVRRQLRPLLALTSALYLLSLGLLLWASTLPVPIRAGQVTWQGLVDVATAFAVVLLALVVYVRARPLVDERDIRLGYALVTGVVVAGLILMWLFAARLDFNVLLPGLAWRMYVLLQTLPAGLALARQ
jgi:hypothetical protein